MKLTVRIEDTLYHFLRPADLETLWENMDDADPAAEDKIPYWVEIWPAAIVLARWLSGRADELRGRTCLDLGCGLGLTASVAAFSARRVLAMDLDFSALTHARQSARLNQTPMPGWLQMDWRHPAVKRHACSRIWGADILYESRFFSPLLDLFEHALQPGGKIWITTPVRDVSSPFWTRLAEYNWPSRKVMATEVSHMDFTEMRVELWEINRPRP